MNETRHLYQRRTKQVEDVIYDRPNPVALFSVLLAGLALGIVAHELLHVLVISNPTTISLHLGDPNVLFSVCCLQEGEDAFEAAGLFLQFAVMIVWVVLNKEEWLHTVRHEPKD